MTQTQIAAGQVKLALQYEREGRRSEARALFEDAARAGDAQAQYLLGVRIINGGRAAGPARGVELVNEAAAQGHGPALALAAVLAAAGYGVNQDWRAAMDLLAKAAQAGDLRARLQLALLGPPDKFDPGPWLAPPPPRMQFDVPRIGVIERFLPPPVCDWLIGLARPNLKQAFIVDAATGEKRPAPERTNTGMYLSLLVSDVVVRLIKARIAAALGAPVVNQEDSNILHYDVGQVFKPHYDFLDPSMPGNVKEIGLAGQRVATFLIYLNDDFEGGETAFPELNWSFKGGKGDALLFWNVSPDGAIEPKLLHAGCPPTRGEKWLFSQWVRDRPLELI